MGRYPGGVLLHVASSIAAQNRRPALVAVDGQGGSGKSTFARELAGLLLAAVVVEGDDFYRVMPEDVRARLGPEEGYESYFDWQRLRDQVLDPVRSQESVLRYQRYDWQRGQLGESLERPMPDVVIVEGVYTLRPQLRDLFDLRIFVQTSTAARLRRQEERGENTSAWIQRWVAAEDHYVSTWAPQAAAEIVIQGD